MKNKSLRFVNGVILKSFNNFDPLDFGAFEFELELPNL